MRNQKSVKTEIPPELGELVHLVAALPDEYRSSFEKAISQASVHIDRRRKILGCIQESLAQLRLDMRYLMFDLEATRRERDCLRDQLDT
ncbi:MAG: transcriptional regulator [Thermoguttaceae bacterium]